MRIGIVTTWFERGAAYVSKQYQELLENSHEVFIYARGGEEFAESSSKWNEGNITWGVKFKNSTRTQINIKHFTHWIKSNKIEAVLFNEQHEWLPVIACDELGVITGSYIDYYKEETVPFFNIYDFLICNTKRHYSVFKDFNQSIYIPWGTDISLFKPKTLKPISSKVIFFHSAGMNPSRKGTDFILKAANKLIDKDFELIIHTQTDLIQFFPGLSSIINDLLKKEKLKLISKTVSAPGLYYKGDVYIYPTRLEGIGLTVPEALACGLPVITTNQAPMNEFVKEKINGCLIDVEREEKRSDNYYWKQSIISLNSLISKMDYYITNFDNIETEKIEARDYVVNFLDWNSNKETLNLFFNNLKKIDSSKKESVKKIILNFEKSRPFTYYLNTYKPYLKFKKKIKILLKKK